MDRNTDIVNMDAPGVGSGKDASETILKGTAKYPLPSESGSNTLEEYTTEKQPTSGAGGQAKH
jgi:hypothetical protein